MTFDFSPALPYPFILFADIETSQLVIGDQEQKSNRNFQLTCARISLASALCHLSSVFLK